MRAAVLGLIGAITFTALTAPANAAPSVTTPAQGARLTITTVAGGCGWGFHPNRSGRCAPNRNTYYRPYWRPYYYGDGHEPWNRPSPTDRTANRLNRQELRGIYSGY
jgi:hypothetical protein